MSRLSVPYLRRRRGREVLPVRAQGPAPAPAGVTAPSAPTLLAIVQHAVELQPGAQRVLEECIVAGGKSAELARRGGRITAGYFQLREQLRTMPQTDDVQQASWLLNYHQQIVEQALIFGYRGFDSGRQRVLEGWRDGLGHPAVELRELHDRLCAESAHAGHVETKRS